MTNLPNRNGVDQLWDAVRGLQREVRKRQGSGSALQNATVTKGGPVFRGGGAVTTVAADGTATRLAGGVAEVQAAPGGEWVPLEQSILGQVPNPTDGQPPTWAPTVELIPAIGVVYVKVTPQSNPDPVTHYTVYVNGVAAKSAGATLIDVPVDAAGVALPTTADTVFRVSASDADGEGPLSVALSARPRKIDPAALGQEVIDRIDSQGAKADAAQTTANQAVADALAAAQKAQSAQNAADDAIRTWYQETAPTGLNNTTDLGDLWYKESTGMAYRWAGSLNGGWTLIRDNAVSQALAAAAAAQTTADAAAADAASKATPASVAAAEQAAKAAAALDATAKANAALAGAQKYVQSRGSNLVTNGSGLLGDASNFPGMVFTAGDAPVGASGSFRTPSSAVRTQMTDELLPVDPSKVYELSFAARQVTGTGRLYSILAPHDSYGNLISPRHCMEQAGTRTTLAVELKNGDTKVRLTSAAGWANAAGGATHLRSIIFWDYVDAGGKAWAPGTYSRNITAVDLWADGAVVGNEITLRTPWAGGTKPAGTVLGNGSSGGSYMFIGAPNVVVPPEWTGYSGRTVKGAHTNLTVSATTQFPVPTATVKAGFLLNYTGSSGDSVQAVANVALTEVGAASDAQAAAAADATTKANAAQTAAITAAATDATTKANNAKTAAEAAAATTAQAKADAAQAAAIASASGTAQAKADAAQAAAVAEAAVTAQAKADAAYTAAQADATSKANAAKAYADAQVAANGRVIAQVSPPTGGNAVPQNIWMNISGTPPKNQFNRYDTATSSWVPITDKIAADAAAAAYAAQQTADAATQAATTAQASANAKTTNFYSGANPPGDGAAGYKQGDTWIKFTGGDLAGRWVHNGTGFRAEIIPDAMVGNLDAAKITTGFLNVAILIEAGAITTKMLATEYAEIGELYTREGYIGKLISGQVDGITLTGSTVQTAVTGQRVVHDSAGSSWYGPDDQKFAGFDIATAMAFIRGRFDAEYLTTKGATLGGVTKGAAGGSLEMSAGTVADPPMPPDHESVPVEVLDLKGSISPRGSNAVWDATSSRWWRAAVRTASTDLAFHSWNAAGVQQPVQYVGTVWPRPLPGASHTSIAVSPTHLYALTRDRDEPGGWVVQRFPRTGSTISAADCANDLPPVPGGYQHTPAIGLAGDGQLLIAYTVTGAQTIGGVSYADKDVTVGKYSMVKAGNALATTLTKTIKIGGPCTDLADVAMAAPSGMYDLAPVTGNTGLVISGKNAGLGAFGLDHIIVMVPDTGTNVTATLHDNAARAWYGGKGGVSWNGTAFWQLNGNWVEKLITSPVSSAGLYHGYTYHNSAGGYESAISPLDSTRTEIYARYISRWSIPTLPAGVNGVRIYVGNDPSRLRLERQGGASGSYVGTPGEPLIVQALPTALPSGTANAVNPPPAASNWPVGTPFEIKDGGGAVLLNGAGTGSLQITSGPVAVAATSPFTNDVALIKKNGVVYATGGFTRASGFDTAFAKAGDIPASYRPAANIDNTGIFYNSTASYTVAIGTDGVVSIRMTAAAASSMQLGGLCWVAG